MGGRDSLPARGARRHAKCIATALAATLLLACLSGCTRWFFHPDARLVGTPADFGYAYRDVAVRTADGFRLHAWLIEPEGPPTGTVYFLHGNAQNVSTHVRGVLWLLAAGYRLFALDYRGYGLSEGHPDIPEVFEDIRAGAEWLLEDVDTRGDRTPLYVFGQSLGASLAIRQLALHPTQRARLSALVVEAAFTRYGEIARHAARGHLLTRPLGWPAERLLAGPHDPIDAVAALAPLPILFVHSVDDRIVPYAFGVELHAAAGEPKAFLPVTGRHIAAARKAEARRTILRFLEAHTDDSEGRARRSTPSGQGSSVGVETP